MLGVPNYPTFVLGAVVIILLPGPNSMYVLTTAAREGARRGWLGAAGVFVSDSLLMLAAVGGVSAVVQANPLAFRVVTALGAAYLAWLGARLVLGGTARWRGRPTHGEVPDEIEPAVGGDHELEVARRRRSPFLGAILLGVLNPKSILFFVAFFTPFLTPGQPGAWRTFAVLWATCQVLSQLYLAALIYGGSRLAEMFAARHRLAGAGTVAVGLVFVLFAARLASGHL